MQIAWATYESETLAARVTDALLATGFAPNQIYAIVQRDRQLKRAPVGLRRRLGYAALIGAALVATLGSAAAALSAADRLALAIPFLEGLRPLAAGILAIVPFGLIGALLGAGVGASLWRMDGDRFPNDTHARPTFVGVRVSAGNAPLARRVLELERHAARISETEDPLAEARKAFEPVAV